MAPEPVKGGSDVADKATRRILVGGIHAGGDGYPNAWQTLRVLERRFGVMPVECGRWLPAGVALWRASRGNKLALIKTALVLACSNLWSALVTLRRARQIRAPVYVPYPAPFFLWWMSWIPREIRPRLIADAYISMWDSWVNDRASSKPGSLQSRVLKRFEQRALRVAHRVLTDTEANRLFYIHAFGLRPEQVRSIPLAIAEDRFLQLRAPESARGQPLRVLFIGTMIPLHGVETIVRAISLVAEKPGVNYRLIGDGQSSDVVRQFLEQSGRKDVTWVRSWQSLEELAREIEDATICLGIFGGTPKSARVLPFKVYMYLAAGRPIVTQEAYSLPEGIPPPPFVTVPSGDAAALAKKIQMLLDDRDLRERLGNEGREYFRKHLGSATVAARWHALLSESEEQDAPRLHA